MQKQNLRSLLVVGLLISAITLMQSCTKIGQNLKFTLPMQTGTANISLPATAINSGSLTFGPATTNFNVDSFIRASTANQLNSSNISSVKIVSMVLTLTNPTPANNFANLESLSASFSSNTDSNPYILSMPTIADNYTISLNLPVDSTELSTYLGNQFYYSISAKLRRATTIPLNCSVSYSFNVVVQG